MRHGEPPKLWPSVLGIVSVALVAAAFIWLLIVEPGTPEPDCRYASGSVTVEVRGPDCVPVLHFIATNTGRTWVSTTAAQGPVYAQLYKGKDTVRIYDHGEPALARELESYFQKAQWIVVAPSPGPSLCGGGPDGLPRSGPHTRDLRSIEP